MLSRFWKAGGYSLVLLGLLALATYFLYWLPVQVRARIREPLRALRLEVDVEDFTGDGTRHTVRFYGRSSTDPFLTVEGLERAGRTGTLDDLPGWVSSLRRGVELGGLASSWRRFHASAALLDLRRDSEWNFLSSLEGPTHGTDAITPLFFRADAVAAQLKLDDPARGPWSLRGSELHCVALPSSGTLILRAELEGDDDRGWNGGDLKLWLTTRSIVERAQISVRNLKRLEDWLPFLPKSFSRLEAAFRPRGPVDLELVDWRRGETTDAETLEATLSQYDSTIRLPGSKLTLERVVGEIRLENGSVAFGEDAGDGASPLDGMLAGERVYFHGKMAGEKRPAFSLVFPAVSLRSLDRLVGRALPDTKSLHRRLADLLVGFEPRGIVSLRFTSGRSEEADRWSLVANFPRAQLTRLPFATNWMGRLDLEGDSESGKLTARLEGVDLAGAGELMGSLELSYDADSYRLRILDSKGLDSNGLDSNGAESAEAGPDASLESGPGIRIGRYDSVEKRWEKGSAGTIEGSLSWPRGAGPTRGQLVIRTLPLEIGSGTLDLRIERAVVTAAARDDGDEHWSIEIAGELGSSTVALDDISPIDEKKPGNKRARFEGGSTKWKLSSSGLRVVSLKLHGEPGTFYFEGGVDWDGTLNGRASLTTKKEADGSAEGEKEPPRWLQVTGSITRPRFRPIPPARTAPESTDPDAGDTKPDDAKSDS